LERWNDRFAGLRYVERNGARPGAAPSQASTSARVSQRGLSSRPSLHPARGRYVPHPPGKTRIEAARTAGGVMARAAKSSASGLEITPWSKKCCQAADRGTPVSSKVSRIARAPLQGSCRLRLSRAPRGEGRWEHQVDVARLDSPARKYESARKEAMALGAFARRHANHLSLAAEEKQRRRVLRPNCGGHAARHLRTGTDFPWANPSPFDKLRVRTLFFPPGELVES
jgi:hypothetical protein